MLLVFITWFLLFMELYFGQDLSRSSFLTLGGVYGLSVP